jgi:hypothetical protein
MGGNPHPIRRLVKSVRCRVARGLRQSLCGSPGVFVLEWTGKL